MRRPLNNFRGTRSGSGRGFASLCPQWERALAPSCPGVQFQHVKFFYTLKMRIFQLANVQRSISSNQQVNAEQSWRQHCMSIMCSQGAGVYGKNSAAHGRAVKPVIFALPFSVKSTILILPAHSGRNDNNNAFAA